MSNLNLEPFELSKWNDTLITEIQESQGDFVNIYRGLNTNQDELDFWYLPRKWEGATFDPLSTSDKFYQYKVIVDVEKPEQRNDNLVHIDFSTSTLDFKPNTYYTFLLQLDFNVPNAKLPNWEAYQTANPKANMHYLISLVRQDVPGSIWNMPKPIFDSSLAISYGGDGFNLRNSQFNKEYEVGQLFTYMPTKSSGEIDVNKAKVILIGCLKTNDFLKENSTLGMWSFLESWVNDYWKAAMEVYVFEDKIVSERPEVYSKIYKKITNQDYIPTIISTEVNLKSYTQQLFREAFPEKKEEPISKNYAFYGIKQQIDEIIKKYYIDLRDYVQNFKNAYIQNNNKTVYEALKEDENFQFNYAISTNNGPQFIDSSSRLIKKVSQASLEAAQAFYLYFPDLTFPYRLMENKDSTAGIVYYHSNNFTSSYSTNIINSYLENIKISVLTNFILSSNVLSNPIYSDTNKWFYLQDNSKKDILEVITDEFINNKVKEYWTNLCPNNNNKIYEFLNNVYNLDNLHNDRLASFAISDNLNELSEGSLELFARRGSVLFQFPEYQELVSLFYKYSKLVTFEQLPASSRLVTASQNKIKNNMPLFLSGLLFTYFSENYQKKNIKTTQKNFYCYPILKNGTELAFERLTVNSTGFRIAYDEIVQSLIGTGGTGSVSDLVRTNFNKLIYDIFQLHSESINSNYLENIANMFNDIIAKKNNTQYLKEQKEFIFGALDGPKSFAQDVVLTESTKDAVNTLTFSLYSNYYTEDGIKERNPFIDLLHEEDKLKLKYKDKWYDFIITDSDLDSSANKMNYTAKDAFVKELSKIGFNKTFNSELDNNVGTINELSMSAVEDTNWKINEDKMDKFYQGALRPIIGGTLKDTIFINAFDYYYDKDLKKNSISSSGFTIKKGSFIYIFYDEELKNEENKTKINYKILYLPPTNSSTTTTQNDYEKMNNILTNVNIYPFVEFRDGNSAFIPSMIEYNVNNITITAPDIFDSVSVIFDYKIRANDIVTKAITHYSVPLKRYVTEYKDTQSNNKILYGYVQSKYSTKPLVQNLLPNGEDFTSLTGWVNGAVNNLFDIKVGLGAATRGSDISTVTPYLNFKTSVESGTNREPHGFICNTDLSYNFAGVHELNPGDELVLRVQVERGENFTPLSGTSSNYIDDQLTLMETLRPYLYFYKNVSSLQAKTDNSVLPLKSQQVVQFIQDKRYVDTAKYESGLRKDKTTAWYGESMYNPSFHDLSKTLNNQGLVSLHWSNYAKNYSSKKENNKTYDNSAYNINVIPCAYIKRELAKTWASQGYLQTFDNAYQRRYSSGASKSYYFTYTGWNNFRKLFYEDTSLLTNERNSTFRLRDFAIIGDIPLEACKHPSSDNISVYPGGTTHMHYFLPFLFSDKDLEDAMNDQPGTTEKVPINEFYNHFFRYSKWQDILKTKEYYELSSDNRGGGQLRAYPHNIEIDFGAEENSIACMASDDYNDFDLLMRMRAFWYLKKYSKTDTCIFETQGTFYGKPLLNGSNYAYKTNTIGPVGYTYQDLLTNHLGLFFTFDQTRYDDGAKGNASVAISKVELFKKYVDEDGELILPDKIIESNTTPIYKFYDPVVNKDVISENDILYETTDVKIDPRYVPNIDLTGEKRNSITITESNVYNILQKIAEIFDGWLVIDVEHDEETGELILDKETHLPKKEIYFINNHYTDNFSGIKYGINLQKIGRKVDSNEVITKLIVKNNNNEFGTNGFCSIARSKYNLNGTNALFNLDYLISTKQLPEEVKDYLYNDIYPKTYAYGQFLANLITQRAEQVVVLSQTQAEADYNKLIINEAKDKLSDFEGRYESLSDTDKKVNSKVVGVGYFINNKQATNKKPSGFQNIINSIIFYQSLVDGFTSKYKDSITAYNDASRKYSLLQDITESVTYQRDSLINSFQALCQGKIKEGAWSSEDYIDDDLYYLDSEKQLQEYSQPQVTYSIDIVDISSLPEWKDYTFNLRDKTTMEDPEIFGYDEDGTPIKIDIIVTEKTSNLQSPDKNTIKVQNYKTQFNDLFQRMASTIQAVEFGTLNYTNKNSANSLENRLANNEIGLQTLMAYNGI